MRQGYVDSDDEDDSGEDGLPSRRRKTAWKNDGEDDSMMGRKTAWKNDGEDDSMMGRGAVGDKTSDDAGEMDDEEQLEDR